MSSPVKLGKRLAAAYAAAVFCCDEMGGSVKIADIGTDHGLLPIRILQDNKADFAVLSDKSPNSLKKAAEAAAKNGLSAYVSTVLCAGFDDIPPDNFDLALICGMGGLNIIEILRNAVKQYGERICGKRFVLQPQSDVINLRAFLFDFGFNILREKGVTERGKAYTVIVARCDRVLSENGTDYAVFSQNWGENRAIWLGSLDSSVEEDRAFLQKQYDFYRPKQRDYISRDSRRFQAYLGLFENLERCLYGK